MCVQSLLHALFIITYVLKKWLGAGLAFIAGFVIEAINGFQLDMMSIIAITCAGIILGVIIEAAAFFVGKAYCKPQYITLLFASGYLTAGTWTNSLPTNPDLAILAAQLFAILWFALAVYTGLAIGHYIVNEIAKRKAQRRWKKSGYL